MPALGGGIWNGYLFDDVPIQLVLQDSTVTDNTVQGDSGITLEGGGLYTEVPVVLKRTSIASNVPDECAGC